jgi:hypothetical protein
MRKTVKIKSAICPKCGSKVFSANRDYFNRDTKIIFDNFKKQGFNVIAESNEDASIRKFSNIKDCLKHK